MGRKQLSHGIYTGKKKNNEKPTINVPKITSAYAHAPFSSGQHMGRPMGRPARPGPAQPRAGPPESAHDKPCFLWFFVTIFFSFFPRFTFFVFIQLLAGRSISPFFSTKIRTPILIYMGIFNGHTQFVYLGCTIPHSILSRPNQRPINVEYFQAQHPCRANQPRALTSDSIQVLVTHSVRVEVSVRVRVGWYLLT